MHLLWVCFVCCRFNQILCQRSFAHLRAVFDEYAKISKKTVEEAVKSEFSGDIKDGLLTVGMIKTGFLRARASIAIVHISYVNSVCPSG